MKLNRLVSSPWRSLAVAGAVALFDAVAVEPNSLDVARVDVPVRDHVDRLAGVRVAQLTDLHVGGVGWKRGVLARAMAACDEQELDLIAITGDLIGSAAGVEPVLELLSALRSDVPRLAVLGNHDHVHGRRPLEALCGGLRELGIVLLRNEALPLELRSGRVWVVGVDDAYSSRDDLTLAVRRLGREEFPRVLLTHYPDLADRLAPGQFQLCLAGHSHGGQIRIPILTSLVHNGHARTRYASGLYVVNGNPLYVSPGLGTSGVPLRFRNWPQLALLSFVPAKEPVLRRHHRRPGAPVVDQALRH